MNNCVPINKLDNQPYAKEKRKGKMEDGWKGEKKIY